jgi:hypothetical protein
MEGSSSLVQTVTLLTCTMQVPSSKPCRSTDCPNWQFLCFDVITSLVSMEHGVYGCEKVTSLGEVTSNGLA